MLRAGPGAATPEDGEKIGVAGSLRVAATARARHAIAAEEREWEGPGGRGRGNTAPGLGAEGGRAMLAVPADG